MSRSSASEKTRRINATLALLNKYSSRPLVATEIVQTYGISLRQAYRYLEMAEDAGDVLPVPEEKVVFTVKLPQSQVEHMRRLSQSSGETISDLTRQALDSFLQEKFTRGWKATKSH